MEKVCKVCGSTDLVPYTHTENGKTYYRAYCREHWNELQISIYWERERKTKGKYSGWRRVVKNRKHMVDGTDMIVFHENAYVLTMFRDGYSKSWKMREMKVFKSKAKIVEMILGLGYELVESGKRISVYVRPVEKRIENRIEEIKERERHAATLRRKDHEAGRTGKQPVQDRSKNRKRRRSARQSGFSEISEPISAYR